MDFIGKYYLQGNNLIETNDAALGMIHRGVNVYEVVRLINDIPLFFERHCLRLVQSAKYIGIDIELDFNDLLIKIRTLALKNEIYNGNIKIVLGYPGAPDMLYLFFIPHHYPSHHDYKRGVEMLSLIAERTNPNAKVSNPGLRAQADQIIKDQGVSEVLLVDSEGFITEGSRSNIFFVQNKTIFTPALHQVLPGITREMVIEICIQNGISIHETKIRYSDLRTFQGAFITGTSPKVLPVQQIDDVHFSVEISLIREIMEYYEKSISGLPVVVETHGCASILQHGNNYSHLKK